MKRIDRLNRTERYFTSTLFGGLLLNENLRGAREFLAWLIENKRILLNQTDGSDIKIPLKIPTLKLGEIQVLTEFNIKREVKYQNKFLPEVDMSGCSEYQRVPDVVIVYGDILLVIEAKFFVSGQTSVKIDNQLQMQKEEIQLMIDYMEGEIKYWSHIYLGPKELNLKNCDAQLTWTDIEIFSEKLLGKDDYITENLHSANSKFSAMNKPTNSNKNYDSTTNFNGIILLCKEHKDKILVGFDGGIKAFKRKSFDELKRRREYKYDFIDGLIGTKDETNWIDGNTFLYLISQKQLNQ